MYFPDKTMIPAISVIIPIFNTAPWLCRSLDSISQQTLRNIEIICINDNSTDQSNDIIHQYADKDGRFLAINLGANRGVSVARNIGLSAARAEWVGFLDSDDEVEHDFFEKLYTEAINSDTEIVKGICWSEKNAPKYIDKSYNISIKESKYNFWKEFCTAIYNKELLQRNNISFLAGCTVQEDVSFAYGAALCANRIAVIDTALYKYHLRPNSATSQPISYKMIVSMINSYRKMTQDINTRIKDTEIYIFEYLKQILSCLRLYGKNLVPQDATAIYELLSKSLIEFIDNCRAQTQILDFIHQYDRALAELLTSKDTAGLTAHYAKRDFRLLHMHARVAKQLKRKIAPQVLQLCQIIQQDPARFL